MRYCKCKFFKFSSFTLLCLMNGNISACSGSSLFRRSVYMILATLNSRSLGTEVIDILRKCRDTSHRWVETCVVSPPRCRWLGQRYIWMCQVQPNLVCSCIRDSCLGTSCLHPMWHNFMCHARQLTGSFHAGPFHRGRQLAVAVSCWHCNATYHTLAMSSSVTLFCSASLKNFSW